MKQTYSVPQLKVHGTVSELTRGIKQLGNPGDGLYLGNKENPLTGSCSPAIQPPR